MQKKILVIEDDKGILDTLLMIIPSLLNSKVRGAESIDGAVELMGNGFEPDLILLDYFLDGEEGGDCVKNLHRLGSKDRIVIMTAGSIGAEQIQRNTGVKCVLRKPFSLEVLEQVL